MAHPCCAYTGRRALASSTEGSWWSGEPRAAWGRLRPPGLGLAEWPGISLHLDRPGGFCLEAIEVRIETLPLGRSRHRSADGFELATALPDRVASLTVLNTIVEVDTFTRPWSMEPFARRGLGEIYLKLLTKPTFRMLMRLQGIEDMSATSRAELDAYVDLLRRGDGGTAFLRIMRSFERTREKSELYASALREVPYPVQVVWGDRDPALKLAVQGEQARRIAGLAAIERVHAKHFPQEDQAPAIAEHISRLAASTNLGPTGDSTDA